MYYLIKILSIYAVILSLIGIGMLWYSEVDDLNTKIIWTLVFAPILILGLLK